MVQPVGQLGHHLPVPAVPAPEQPQGQHEVHHQPGRQQPAPLLPNPGRVHRRIHQHRRENPGQHTDRDPVRQPAVRREPFRTIMCHETVTIPLETLKQGHWAVTRAMLDNMPDLCDLHLERAAGRCAMMVGSAVLSEYAESDVVMRNFAVTTARRAGFGGTRVAEVFGLSAPTCRRCTRRPAGRLGALVKQPGPGRPPKLGGEALGRARRWRAAGVSDREIGRRLGMPRPRPGGGWARGARKPRRRTAGRARRRAASRWSAWRKPPGTTRAARLSLPLLRRLPRMPSRSGSGGCPRAAPRPSCSCPSCCRCRRCSSWWRGRRCRGRGGRRPGAGSRRGGR